MADDLFIDDGQTLTRTIEAIAGQHGKAVIEYRAAGYGEFVVWNRAAAQGGAAVEKYAAELFAKHLVSINGTALPTGKKLRPLLADKIVDSILGYVGSDEERADSKN